MSVPVQDGIVSETHTWVYDSQYTYIVQHNPFLTKTFLLRSKHQLSNNASILAKSASITGEAGDSTGERDDDDDDSCSASGVFITGVNVFVSTKYIKVCYTCKNNRKNIHIHVHVVPKYLHLQCTKSLT